MTRLKKGILHGSLTLIGLALLVLFVILPSYVDGKKNVVLDHAPYQISERAQTLHDSLRVADLHADTLLWKRNPAKRQSRGHTDFVRLREGNVALQVFTTVTFVPKNMNTGANTANKDAMTLLTIAQLWPIRTWSSIFERATYQAQRLQKLEQNAGGDFIIARTQSDLANALTKRHTNKNMLVGILGTEGAHPLEGKLENLDKLYAEGYRQIGLQHFFDNELGGSLHGVSKAGLSPFGREVIDAIADKGMIIDVAHSSVQTVKDVLAMTDAPIVISHTGIVSLCNHPDRNIPDHLLKQIADRGGIIGVGYWETAVCDTSPDGIAKMLIHGANTFGVDHIALGSDYDGAVTTRFDVSEIAVLTDALLKQGMSDDHIRKVMGENQIAFYLKHLPK
ncbi:MAG: peptidase M19 [Robiginitomaculum sp.]|nr:MAG: peptidase M19 [Robiginitomaculum sp.]